MAGKTKQANRGDSKQILSKPHTTIIDAGPGFGDDSGQTVPKIIARTFVRRSPRTTCSATVTLTCHIDDGPRQRYKAELSCSLVSRWICAIRGSKFFRSSFPDLWAQVAPDACSKHCLSNAWSMPYQNESHPYPDIPCRLRWRTPHPLCTFNK
jgi:hypothetical protein